MQRFVIALMRHETNTFSPLPTPLAAFGRVGGEPLAGDAAVAAYQGTNNPIAAFLDLAREAGAEIDVPVAANAVPSGPVSDQAFEVIAGAVCEAVDRGCDAAFLDLLGAMVTESHDDGEGALLRRLRRLAPDLPIAVALDFHTNLTADMVDNATVITAYRTYPHVDMYETGARAGCTLLRALRREVSPVMAWGSRPMLTHMLRQTPARQPMRDIMDRAIAAEASNEVVNASVLGGFPLADIPHAALSAVVVTDGDRAAGQTVCDELLDMAWARRADFVYRAAPLADSIAHAKTLADGPVILADHGDNSGAGGPQDDMAALGEVLRQGLDDVAAGPICDPQVAATLIEAGVGAEVTVELGGKMALGVAQNL